MNYIYIVQNYVLGQIKKINIQHTSTKDKKCFFLNNLTVQTINKSIYQLSVESSKLMDLMMLFYIAYKKILQLLPS